MSISKRKLDSIELVHLGRRLSLFFLTQGAAALDHLVIISLEHGCRFFAKHLRQRSSDHLLVLSCSVSFPLFVNHQNGAIRRHRVDRYRRIIKQIIEEFFIPPQHLLSQLHLCNFHKGEYRAFDHVFERAIRLDAH